MSQQAEWTAVRSAVSSTLSHIQGIASNGYTYSFRSAVRNFEKAVGAWEVARTPGAASAVLAAALVAIDVAPYERPAGRPSPWFHEGAEKIIAGLTKIVSDAR